MANNVNDIVIDNERLLCAALEKGEVGIVNANLLFGPRAEMPGRGPANHGNPDPLSMTPSMSLTWPMTPVVPPVQRVRQCSGEHLSSQDSLTKVSLQTLVLI